MSQRNARLQLQLGDAERLQAQADLHSMLLYRTLMEGMLLVRGRPCSAAATATATGAGEGRHMYACKAMHSTVQGHHPPTHLEPG